nr:MarR family transcriptional regulator [Verrucomicrobium spinosum]
MLNPTDHADSLGASLRRPYRLLQERVYAELAASGFPEIRAAHSAVFRHILPEGSRLTALAEQAGMTKQSMAYLVEHLVEHGHVSVGPDPDDGRARRVRLTPRGERFIQAALSASQRVEDLLSAELGAKAMRELRRILGDIETVLMTPENDPRQSLAQRPTD